MAAISPLPLAEEKNAAAVPPKLPCLTGTIKSAGAFIGIIALDKAAQAVRCGDFIGAWRVVKIDESSLTLADAQQNFFTCKLKGT